MAEAKPSEPIAALQNIRAGTLDPSKLSTATRRSIVMHLILEAISPQQIAAILKVNRSTIWRDQQIIRQQMAENITDLDVREIAGEHMARAQHVAGKLMRAKKWGEAWRVHRDLIADLQSLGFLVKTPTRIEVTPALQELDQLPEAELRAETKRILDAEFSVSEVGSGAPEESSGQGGD